MTNKKWLSIFIRAPLIIYCSSQQSQTKRKGNSLNYIRTDCQKIIPGHGGWVLE